jgi:hypothetical protein
VLEAELDNNILLLQIVFNGVLPIVGPAETSRCRAKSLTSRLCLVLCAFVFRGPRRLDGRGDHFARSQEQRSGTVLLAAELKVSLEKIFIRDGGGLSGATLSG